MMEITVTQKQSEKMELTSELVSLSSNAGALAVAAAVGADDCAAVTSADNVSSSSASDS